MIFFDSAWNWLTSNVGNVIALCALGATFWQAYLTRRHGRLSVKPHLEICTGFNFNQQEYFINLLNNGIGPALVKKIQFFVDGSEVNAQKPDVLSDVVSTMFHLYRYNLDYFIISDSYMMKPNEEKVFLKVKLLESLVEFPVTNSEEIEKIRSRIKISITYESIYGEKYLYNT